LTDDLKDLSKKLENRSNRIQSDIVEYAELSQSAVQLTKIVSDSVAQVERRSGSDNPRSVVERLDSATVPMPATTKK
jgi:Adhesin lipoprotein